MEEVEEKFKNLEKHLDILIEKLNTDLHFLSAWDLAEKVKYEDKIRNVMKVICLLEVIDSVDISFLNEDFQESLIQYQIDTKRDFNHQEISDLSQELVEQLKPNDFKFE